MIMAMIKRESNGLQARGRLRRAEPKRILCLRAAGARGGFYSLSKLTIFRFLMSGSSGLSAAWLNASLTAAERWSVIGR